MIRRMPEKSSSSRWQWWVSGLLLLATMINYMDRQTLSNLAVRITDQFRMSQEQYGDIEFVFGVAFALGSLTFGIIADRVSVRFLYPFVLVAWSAIGIATGLTESYQSLLICRALLGFFEAGHWPCALIVTQAIMSRGDRVLGNSILQSGASLGAIVTPIVIRMIVGDNHEPNIWRLPFFIIGGVGFLWAALWLRVIHPGDLLAAGPEKEPSITSRQPIGLPAFLSDRRFWALALMVICINTSWQLIRAWLPKFMQQGRGYTEAQALYFNSVYFIATDIGCILAGVAALMLVRRGLSVHSSRVWVYGACAALAALTSLAAELPKGWPLLAVMLLVAAGTLGVFPCYYSFTQEVSKQNMGKLTGTLSFIGWLASAPVQKFFGRFIDQSGSFDWGLALVGWAPMFGLVGFLLLWPRGQQESESLEYQSS
jgi:MFS transporter, ACS family, hexuronate transporter